MCRNDESGPSEPAKGGQALSQELRCFLSWFPDDAACLDYLEWLRWPSGFSCPDCSGIVGRRMKDGRWWCKACRRRVSATAGTIFHHTKTPLTIWFAAAWHMITPKNGVSAKTLHRLLGFGSYQTAWAMLHRFRSAIGHSEHTRLSGDVEVDETMIGGARPGKRGRGACSSISSLNSRLPCIPSVSWTSWQTLNPKRQGKPSPRLLPRREHRHRRFRCKAIPAHGANNQPHLSGYPTF